MDDKPTPPGEKETLPVVYTERPDGPGIYSTFVNFSAGANEVVLDFYQTLPGVQDDRPAVVHHLVARIILPLYLLKGFVSGLANLVTRVEIGRKMNLPNVRQPEPGDSIKLWE